MIGAACLPSFPSSATFCKGVVKVKAGNEFAPLIHYRRRHYSLPEADHGARTLAPVVPPADGGRQGLLPEVRPTPAVGPGRRHALGGAARPAAVVGLPAPPPVHHDAAARPAAVA